MFDAKEPCVPTLHTSIEEQFIEEQFTSFFRD